MKSKICFICMMLICFNCFAIRPTIVISQDDVEKADPNKNYKTPQELLEERKAVMAKYYPTKEKKEVEEVVTEPQTCSKVRPFAHTTFNGPKVFCFDNKYKNGGPRLYNGQRRHLKEIADSLRGDI